MTVKRLTTGYWHVRLGWWRFAQWMVSADPGAAAAGSHGA